MRKFLDSVTVLKAALPRLLAAFNALMGALEHIVFRLALLWFFVHGIYKAFISRR